MNKRLLGAALIVLLPLIVIVGMGVLTSDTNAAALQWRIGQKAENDAQGVSLTPLEEDTCEILMPNGNRVVVSQSCFVVTNCPIIVGKTLQPECNSLAMTESQVSIGSPHGDTVASTASADPVCPSQDYAVHIIRQGDTLWDLSVRYNTRLETLLKLNGLSLWDAEHLDIGYPLCVPAAQQ
jgi:hypothetical protein